MCNWNIHLSKTKAKMLRKETNHTFIRLINMVKIGKDNNAIALEGTNNEKKSSIYVCKWKHYRS